MRHQRSIDLDARRSRVAGAASLAGRALLLLGVGVRRRALLRRSTARGPARDRRICAPASRRSASSSAALDQDSHRNLDALALKLGQLQAQATRLNALGDRLTQVGKLDDGEFDFSSDPALGGPEEPVDRRRQRRCRCAGHRQPARRVRSPGSAARRAREPAARPQGRQRAAAERHAGRAGLHRVRLRRALRSDQWPRRRSISASISTRRSARRSLAVAEGVVTFVGVRSRLRQRRRDRPRQRLHDALRAQLGDRRPGRRSACTPATRSRRSARPAARPARIAISRSG